MHSTAQILAQPEDSDNAMFHTENAGLLSKSAVFALRAYASPVVGGLQGGHRKPNLPMGAVHALCRNAPSVLGGLLPCSSVSPTLCTFYMYPPLQTDAISAINELPDNAYTGPLQNLALLLHPLHNVGEGKATLRHWGKIEENILLQFAVKGRPYHGNSKTLINCALLIIAWDEAVGVGVHL